MATCTTPEDLIHKESGVHLCIGGNDGVCNDGTLYITEHFVDWKGDDDEKEFKWFYPSISLHAISSDSMKKCVYMLVNKNDDEIGIEKHHNKVEHENEVNVDEGNELVEEIRFIPLSENRLQSIYDAITKGQQFHPDPDDSELDEGYYDEECDKEESGGEIANEKDFEKVNEES